MRYILDPAGTWLVQPPFGQSQTNKRPVAIKDVISLEKDGDPVNVDVLANDFDPEGGPLSLISATAELGNAVIEPDDTVTYTPPPGVSGFDTVVYRIADDLGQTRDGQIEVTITEPVLEIATLSDNTFLVMAEAGPLDVTVTDPSALAGSWSFDTGDLAQGPVSLVAPAISGVLSVGTVLSATPGLWVYDPAAGAPAQGWQWRRSGVDIPGATDASYTVTPADLGQVIQLGETQSDSFGQRSRLSAGLVDGGLLFDPASDSALVAWYDASDAGTISETGGQVSSWTDKAGTAHLGQNAASLRPLTGSRSRNGLNVLDFPGNHYLQTPFFLPASGDVALHMALEIDAVSNAFGAVLALEATNDMQIDAASDSQFDGRLNSAWIGPPVDLTGGPFSGFVILSVLFDFTGAGVAEVYVNGILRGSAAYNAALDPVTALHVMTNRSRNASFDGAVGELLVTGTLTNRADYQGYLFSKWGDV